MIEIILKLILKTEEREKTRLRSHTQSTIAFVYGFGGKCVMRYERYRRMHSIDCICMFVPVCECATIASSHCKDNACLNVISAFGTTINETTKV